MFLAFSLWSPSFKPLPALTLPSHFLLLLFYPLASQLASRIQAELHSPDVAGKIVSDDRRALARKSRVAEDASRTQSAHYQGNSSHLAGAGNEQKLIVKQQDVVLDKLESGLDTLNEMANVIQAEVKDQEGVLDDISNKTDEAQNKMTGAIASINKLLGTNNSCQL